MSWELISTLLFFAPALLLALSVSLGCRPGERLLIRLASRRTGRQPKAPTPASSPRDGWLHVNPRGGRLLASPLAGRGPPASLAP